MRNDPVDPETLAALLDGKLSPDERERVLARLAKSEREYDDLIETTALVNELNANPAIADEHTNASHVALVLDSPPAHATRSARWRRPALIGPLVAAASLVLVMVLRAVASRSTDASLFGVIESAAGTERFPAEWPGSRGASDIIAPEAAAFRLGALFTDFDLAFSARDSSAVRTVASRLTELVSSVPAGGPTVARVQFLAGDGMSDAMTSSAKRRTVAADLRSLSATPAWFDLGVWAQAARHAAHAGRVEFFSPDGPAIAELNRVLAVVDSTSSSNTAVSTRSATSSEWPAR